MCCITQQAALPSPPLLCDWAVVLCQQRILAFQASCSHAKMWCDDSALLRGNQSAGVRKQCGIPELGERTIYSARQDGHNLFLLAMNKNDAPIPSKAQSSQPGMAPLCVVCLTFQSVLAACESLHKLGK